MRRITFSKNEDRPNTVNKVNGLYLEYNSGVSTKQIHVCSDTLFPENANIRTRFTVETQTRGIKGCFWVADSMNSSEVRSKEKKF